MQLGDPFGLAREREADEGGAESAAASPVKDSAMKEAAQEGTVHTWDYVSPVAITEEYLESMYRCVSSI